MSEPEVFPVPIELFFAEQEVNPKLRGFEPLVCYSDGDHKYLDGPQDDPNSSFYQEPDHAWSNIVVLPDVPTVEDGDRVVSDLVFDVGTWKGSANLPTLPLKGFGEGHSTTDGCYFWAIDADGQAWGTEDEFDGGMEKCTVRALLVRVAIYPEVLRQVQALVGASQVKKYVSMFQKPKPDYSLN